MTYDDGILAIFRNENISAPGEKPKLKQSLKVQSYYGYETIGLNRFYAAKQVRERIDSVVRIPDWTDIRCDDVCMLEDGIKYIIRMVQPTRDDDGLKMTRLSLERMV